MAQLMPLPLTASCFRKIQAGFTFLVPAHPGSPGKRAVKPVCVYYYYYYYYCRCSIFHASSLGTDGEPVKLPLLLRDRDKPPADDGPSHSAEMSPDHSSSAGPSGTGGGTGGTVVFDYTERFLPALNQYALRGGAAPDPRVHLLIGTKRRLGDIDDKVPIYLTVASQRALQDLAKVTTALQVTTTTTTTTTTP